MQTLLCISNANSIILKQKSSSGIKFTIVLLIYEFETVQVKQRWLQQSAKWSCSMKYAPYAVNKGKDVGILADFPAAWPHCLVNNKKRWIQLIRI